MKVLQPSTFSCNTHRQAQRLPSLSRASCEKLLLEKVSHGQREQFAGCQGVEEGRGEDWGARVGRWKLVYREWISSKVLLYSTGPIFNIQ